MQGGNPQSGGQPVDNGGHPRSRCGPGRLPRCTARIRLRGRRRPVHRPSPERLSAVHRSSTGHTRRHLRERPFSTGSTGVMTNPEESNRVRKPPTVPRPTCADRAERGLVLRNVRRGRNPPGRRPTSGSRAPSDSRTVCALRDVGASVAARRRARPRRPGTPPPAIRGTGVDASTATSGTTKDERQVRREVPGGT